MNNRSATSDLWYSLTGDVQEERGGVVTQHVLCQRRDAHDASSLVDVPDPLLRPAQVGVGHRRAVAKVQLDVGAQGVALEGRKRRSLFSCRPALCADTARRVKAVHEHQLDSLRTERKESESGAEVEVN